MEDAKIRSLYALGLIGATALSACNEPGIYKGVIDGWDAVYDVRVSYSCTLTLEKEDKRLVINDSQCNGMGDTLDSVTTYKGSKRESYLSSTDLRYSGRIKKLNSLLNEGRKLVKPENRDWERERQIEEYYQGNGKVAQEDLDSFLQ